MIGQDVKVHKFDFVVLINISSIYIFIIIEPFVIVYKEDPYIKIFKESLPLIKVDYSNFDTFVNKVKNLALFG